MREIMKERMEEQERKKLDMERREYNLIINNREESRAAKADAHDKADTAQVNELFEAIDTTAGREIAENDKTWPKSRHD